VKVVAAIIAAILIVYGAASIPAKLHSIVKKEAILKMKMGISSLEGFTRKMTR